MKFSNSPYVYLSISACLCFIALGLLPKLSSTAVDIGARPSYSVSEQPAPPVEPAIDPVEPAYDYEEDDVFKVVDEMPLWPGSENEGSYSKRKKKADKLMLEYIYANVKYPEQGKNKGAQGVAVVSFIVEKDGRVSNINVVRDPGAGLGAEAARVVRKMAEDDIYWHPGRQKGKPVRVQFHLPVKFKLNN